MRWDEKEIETIRDLFDAVHACETQEQADAFMAAYRVENEHAYANVGYVIGYADADTRDRLYGLFQVKHPVYGDMVRVSAERSDPSKSSCGSAEERSDDPSKSSEEN